MNGMDKLFLINVWRWANDLKEFPIPGVNYPKPCGLDLDHIKVSNAKRTRSVWLRSIPELQHMFEDKSLNKQRDLGFLMGYFRYENPNSLDYKPNADGVNKNYCIERSRQKWKMFNESDNITYVVDIINLIELWFVGQSFEGDIRKSDRSIIFNTDHHTLVNTLINLYRYWDLYECGRFKLEWTDEGRPEQGIGA